MDRRTCGWILILLGICVTYGQGRLCYICGYNKPTDGRIGIQCTNDTAKLPGPPTNCSNDRVCTFDVQFLRASNEVVSVSRNCLPSSAPRSNMCLDDWTHRQCTYSCGTDLCNNITVQELYRRYGDTDANSAQSFTRIVSPAYIILAVCIVWVVKRRTSP
ncbi:uncharacterized protein LOC117322536 [Pecten maximus]|uniref:uncharacterized protein LOC117322536 n=1 Tax=Pecten maximus TaxID=6579 RepID=UPI0014586A20|nr:uncharacterized protein LOC117322536 [Pecten maximus]